MLDYPEELKRFSLGATHAISCRSDEEVQTTLLFLRYLSMPYLDNQNNRRQKKGPLPGKPGVERAKLGLLQSLLEIVIITFLIAYTSFQNGSHCDILVFIQISPF